MVTRVKAGASVGNTKMVGTKTCGGRLSKVNAVVRARVVEIRSAARVEHPLYHSWQCEREVVKMMRARWDLELLCG